MQPAAPTTALRPAFHDGVRRGLFAAVLLLVLAAPVLLFRIGLPAKQEVYKGVTKEAGKFARLERVIFEEPGNIDMLFFGSSLLRAAIDGPAVEAALSRGLRRKAVVEVAGINWPGMDIQYLLLRDLLEHRGVKTLVLAMPVGQQDTVFPHVQLYRMLRWGDYPDLFEGLGTRARLSLYGTMVVGAPRQALNLLRPNRVADWSGDTPVTGQPRDDETGFYGKRFVRYQKTPPVFAAGEMLFQPETAQRFRFLGQTPNAYQMHFLTRTAELLRQHHVQAVLLNIPLASDGGQLYAPERLFWPDIFGPGSRVIGLPSGLLFEGMAEEERELFYRDEHLNRNGREYFTQAILPALLEAYGPLER